MIFDRSLIPLVAGPLAGLLVMSGVVTPMCSDEVAKLCAGGTIFIASLLIGAVHHVELDKNKQTQISTTTTVVANPAPATDLSQPLIVPAETE